MAADIKKILEDLAKASQEDINEFAKSMEKTLSNLAEVKKKVLSEGNAKAFVELNKLEKVMVRLTKAQKAKLDIEKEMIEVGAENTEAAEKYTQQLEALDEEIKNNSEIIKQAIDTQSNAVRRAQEKVNEYNDTLRQHWRENTKLGKAYTAMTGVVGRYASGITAAGLAMHAFSRFQKANELRTNILIESYRGMNTELVKSEPMMDAFGKDGEMSLGQVAQAAKNLGDQAQQVLEFDKALGEARATALRLGVSVEEAGDLMLKFSRIAGSQNPKDLSMLAQATMSLARSMGTDLGSATEHIAMRMEKFGGTAASAVEGLNEIKNTVDTVNKAFGRQVIRSSDVVDSLNEISRSTNIYALDQRMVAGLLTSSATKLRAMGQSYLEAKKNSENFTKAVTGGAPKWMKILAGQDIMTDMQAALAKGAVDGVDEFEKKFGAELDAKQPGLSKRIKDILQDTKLDQFSKMTLVQELTEGFDIGANQINKRILDLYRDARGDLQTIMHQFGLSSVAEAQALVKQAQEYEDQQKRVAKATAMSKKELQATYGMSEAYAESIVGNKSKIKDYLDIQDRARAKAEAETSQIEKTTDALKARAKLVADIEADQAKIREGGLKPEEIDALTASIKSAKMDLAKLGEVNLTAENIDKARAKLEKDLAEQTRRLETEQLTPVEAEKLKADIAQTNMLLAETQKRIDSTEAISSLIDAAKSNFTADAFMNFGRIIGEQLEKYGTVLTSLLGAAGLGAVTKWLYGKITSIADNVELIAAKSSLGIPSDTDGDGGTTAGPDKPPKEPKGPKGGDGGGKKEMPQKPRKRFWDRFKRTPTEGRTSRPGMFRRAITAVSSSGAVAKSKEFAKGLLGGLKKLVPTKLPGGPSASFAPVALEGVEKLATGMGGVSGALGGLGGILKPMGKVLSFGLKALGPIVTAITYLTDLMGPVQKALSGDFKGALIDAIPAIAGMLGTAVGGVLGTFLAPILGPLGTILGGVAGGKLGDMLGGWVKDKFVASTPSMPEPGSKEAAILSAPSREVTQALTSIAETQKERTSASAPGLPPPVSSSSSMLTAAADTLTGSMEGPFPDGSVVVKIPNFLNTFANAKSMVSGNKP